MFTIPSYWICNETEWDASRPSSKDLSVFGSSIPTPARALCLDHGQFVCGYVHPSEQRWLLKAKAPIVNPSRANRLQQKKNVTSDMYPENVEPQMFSSWVENTQMISNVAKAKASPHVAALDLRGNSTKISCQRHLICADGVLRSCSLSCRRAWVSDGFVWK